MSESYSNSTKHPTTYTNQPRGSSDLTWNEATFTWEEAGSKTWDNPGIQPVNSTKHPTTYTNSTKH